MWASARSTNRPTEPTDRRATEAPFVAISLRWCFRPSRSSIVWSVHNPSNDNSCYLSISRFIRIWFWIQMKFYFVVFLCWKQSKDWFEQIYSDGGGKSRRKLACLSVVVSHELFIDRIMLIRVCINKQASALVTNAFGGERRVWLTRRRSEQEC